jgi:16S rRNA processing protein RimM
LSRDDLLVVGKVVGLHGVKGEIKVLPYSDYNEEAWRVLSISTGDKENPYEVLHGRLHKRVVLLHLAGINSREDAEPLVGGEISVRRELLEELPEGEYYWFELTGMEVETDDGRFLGRIDHIFSTGGNDVFEIHGPLGEVLIPVIKDVVVNVDRERKRVTVHLLEGLLPGE